MQIINLWDRMINLVLDPVHNDTPLWRWNAASSYTSKSTYDMLWHGSVRCASAAAIWKCWAPLSCKIFMWLAMQYPLWTADRRLRHGLQDHTSACYICAQEEDSIDHLLLHCVFARQVWHNCFLKARISDTLVPTVYDKIEDWWLEARACIPKVNRRGFDSVVMLICWHLWKHRNGLVFGPARTSLTVGAFTSQVFDVLRSWVSAGANGVEIFCE